MGVEMNNGTNGNNFHGRNDELNVRISGLIRDHVFSGSVGEKMMRASKDLQVQYYKDCLAHLGEPSFIHDRNQRVLKDLAKVTNSKIVEGEEWINDFPKASPALILLNHFSVYKLTGIEQAELGVHYAKIDVIPPPPIFSSSVFPVAEKLQDNLYDAHLQLPGALGQIQEEGGFISVPPGAVDQFGLVLQETKDFIASHKNSLIVSYPEGGTSGRTNNGGPFDMLDFRKGSFAIASQLDLPILPIAQYFNPDSGFEIGIFKPMVLEKNKPREYYKEVADNTRNQMQTWLDKRKSLTSKAK